MFPKMTSSTEVKAVLLLVILVTWSAEFAAAATWTCSRATCDRLSNELSRLDSGLDEQISNLRTDLLTEIAELQSEVDYLRSRLGGEGTTTTTPTISSSPPVTGSSCGSGLCAEDTSQACSRERTSGQVIPGFANFTSSRYGYPFYSCQTTNFQDYEVYAVGMYGHDDTKSHSLEEVNLHINLAEGATAHPIKLLLSTYEPITWKIHVTSCVDIREVMLVSYYEEASSVEVVGKTSQPTVSKVGDYLGFGHMVEPSGSRHEHYENRYTELTTFAEDNFGFLTSFAGTYSFVDFSLNVGLQC